MASKRRSRRRKSVVGAQPSATPGLELVADSDPEGTAVVHAIRRDATVVDRLFYNGGLGPPQFAGKLHQAGEQFRRDFERAQLLGHYGSIDLMRGRTGSASINQDDLSYRARERVRYALAALGYVPGGSTTSQQSAAAWWVIGEQLTLEQFVWRMRGNGCAMNVGKASGLVVAGLERLALHYGFLTVGDEKQVSSDRGRAEGICAAAGTLRRQVLQARSAAAAAKEKAGISPAEERRQWMQQYAVQTITARAIAKASRLLLAEGERLLGRVTRHA